MTTNKYFAKLDPLRLLLATLVLVFHYLYWGPRAGIQGVASSNHWLLLLAFAVQFFFTISGFVIVQSAHGRTWLQFLFARTRRLWPAIFVCASVTFVLLKLMPAETLGEQSATLKNLLKSTSLWYLVRNGYVDWSYWSLTIELRFYALVALILALKLKPNTVRFIVISYVVARLVLEAIPSALSESIKATDPLRHYGGFFALGAFWADLKVDRISEKSCSGTKACIALCLILTAFQFRYDFNRIAPAGWNHHLSYYVGVLSALVLLAVLCTCMSSSGQRGSPLAQACGSVSYPLYLVHQFVGYALIFFFRQYTSTILLPELLATTLVIVGAVFLDKLVIPSVTHLFDYFARPIKARIFSKQLKHT